MDTFISRINNRLEKPDLLTVLEENELTEIGRAIAVKMDAAIMSDAEKKNARLEAQPSILELGDDLKQSNPKQAEGDKKIPFHLWPETATVAGTLALLDGKSKYGRGNWREAGVLASTYYSAARRHLNAWLEGEDTAPDSGIDHLGHALACIAIVIDAREHNMLIDDRNFSPSPGYNTMVARLTGTVQEIQQKHAHRSPKHWDRRDA